LPLEMREIIVMKHLQGMSYDEIAALLDIPRGSVASRLYRARAELKRKLESRL
jgi:RNA polymerase sigma-70 factor (ECF subfamily)